MFLDKLILIIENPKLSKLLYKSMKEYKTIEDIFEEKLKKYSFYKDFSFLNRELNEKKYFEKNFFSIFFISIFKELHFTKEEVQKYGLIFHMVRMIITSTDNILDNENKGTIQLNNHFNPILKQVLLILLSNEILINSYDSTKSSNTLIETIYKIANGESYSKLKDSTNYPSSDFIIDNIHMNIGGELLASAFDIPLSEKKSSDTISKYREAVLNIGLSLQALDDMTDIEEDFEENKSNLLTAFILEKNEISYNDLKLKNNYMLSFKDEYLTLINYAINKSLYGFKLMEELGYPIKREQALELLKLMFKLRGLEKEWSLYENK